MDLQGAKTHVRGMGFSLTKRDGEFRLALLIGSPNEKEASAYYTNDLMDAVDTARAWYKLMVIDVPKGWASVETSHD